MTPAKVDKVALTARNRSTRARSLIREVPLQADGCEIGVLEERPIESTSRRKYIRYERWLGPGDIATVADRGRSDEVGREGGREELARELDPRRHGPSARGLFVDPGHRQVVRLGGSGAHGVAAKEAAGKGAVQGIGQLQVPMADQPSRVGFPSAQALAPAVPTEKRQIRPGGSPSAPRCGRGSSAPPNQYSSNARRAVARAPGRPTRGPGRRGMSPPRACT